MGESLNKRIENLRKQSRLLLAQADKNSKKVKREIKKINSQNLSFGENYRDHVGERNSWKLRNDSSGVAGALCQNYYCSSPNQTLTSMPNKSTIKRVLVSSKKHSENQHYSENISRKPVKECYCNIDTKKVQLRSRRTQHKQSSPCKCCKSHVNFTAVPVEYNFEKPTVTSPISCETLRRVEKIDYAPRSQFLRNVRSKVSLLQTAAATGDSPESCSRSQHYHEFMARKNIHNADPMHQLRTDDKKSQTSNHLTKYIPVRSETTEESSSSEAENIDRSSKGVHVPLKKHSKPKVLVKRTLSSKTSVPDVKKTKPSSKVATKSKKTVSSKECQYCDKNKPEHSKNVLQRDNYTESEDYQGTVCTNRLPKESDREFLSEREMRELKKFREQNYFDTHGSNHTLVSSKSSGSLEQYLLNDRLFPEHTGRIHKKDLVVTMPPCATTQRKRIHYFPRYIVRQEKSNFNGNCKKKRCQTCPLTGHAIDLGITKIRPPLNSLALKYQKRLP
ncbi:hypothetical protein WH47_09873 [Habropoda laboriosa]|uniref:Uncharacterized protein n=1 Tax=Habropoda laboriosa TaxID=597456 RepID=A0A0L7R387_9HYME|nr:PREDICTED: uncharacterized protein LOC108572466 [Habropoda laboriosa]KOC65294.1 hypothetical protein WH47_09873 [Habropoda laboriosa]